MNTAQSSQISKEIQRVATRLKAGYALTEDDTNSLFNTVSAMRVLLADQPQVEKRLVYALAELFAAIDHDANGLQNQPQIDALYMLADELYSQLLDIFVL